MTWIKSPEKRRLWLVSVVLIVAIAAVGIIINRVWQPHVASPRAVVFLPLAQQTTASSRGAAAVAWPGQRQRRGLATGKIWTATTA